MSQWPWAPAEIFPEGAKPPTLKQFGAFSAREGANENCCVFRRLRPKHRAFVASAQGASENFRVFCRTAAYDVIFFKFHLFLHPPQLRASAPDADEDNVPRTPNVAESFHAHMKQLFNSPRPNQHTSTA